MTALDAELREPLAFPSVPGTLDGAQRYAARLQKRWISDQRRAMQAESHLKLAAGYFALALAELAAAREGLDV